MGIESQYLGEINIPEEHRAEYAQQALKLGRSPTSREVENLREIRTRFRIWEDVLYAIGLPSLKDPEQVKLRAQKNRNG